MLFLRAWCDEEVRVRKKVAGVYMFPKIKLPLVVLKLKLRAAIALD